LGRIGSDRIGRVTISLEKETGDYDSTLAFINARKYEHLGFVHIHGEDDIGTTAKKLTAGKEEKSGGDDESTN